MIQNPRWLLIWLLIGWDSSRTSACKVATHVPLGVLNMCRFLSEWFEIQGGGPDIWLAKTFYILFQTTEHEFTRIVWNVSLRVMKKCFYFSIQFEIKIASLAKNIFYYSWTPCQVTKSARNIPLGDCHYFSEQLEKLKMATNRILHAQQSYSRGCNFLDWFEIQDGFPGLWLAWTFLIISPEQQRVMLPDLPDIFLLGFLLISVVTFQSNSKSKEPASGLWFAETLSTSSL